MNHGNIMISSRAHTHTTYLDIQDIRIHVEIIDSIWIEVGDGFKFFLGSIKIYISTIMRSYDDRCCVLASRDLDVLRTLYCASAC